jgi:hypothetical protein
VTAGSALRLALRDLYGNSWRLVPVNVALGAVLVGVGIAAVAVHAALVLVLVAGPVAAALVHASVTLVRTGNVTLADARAGLVLHWRRGVTLAGFGGALVLLGAFALHFYGSRHLWPLAFLTLYLLALLGTYAVVLLVVAVAEPSLSLAAAAAEAARVAVRRPGATLVLGLALLLVNAAGLAAAVMPFLTVTVAYSCVAVAHFTLPRPTPEDQL